jgi:hypothetical protein
MNLESARLFVSLLEHIIREDSTSINQLQGVPGAVPLLKKLHQMRAIPDDQKYEPVKKVPWSDLKDKPYTLLLAGPKGAGVLQSQRDTYNLYAWNTDTDELDNSLNTSGGRSIEWFQDRIGKIRNMWLGRDLGTVRQLRTKRHDLKVGTGRYLGQGEFARDMLKRFKPLWLRSLTAAQNDVKGWVNTQIKNHAFDKAKSKIDHLRELESAVDSVESGGSLEEISMVANAIKHAINQTTYMYYPEEAQGFEQTRSIYRSEKPGLLNRDAVSRLFADIVTDGDMQKLGTLLAFFRKNLVTG